jgi:hypothetical protein
MEDTVEGLDDEVTVTSRGVLSSREGLNELVHARSAHRSARQEHSAANVRPKP